MEIPGQQGGHSRHDRKTLLKAAAGSVPVLGVKIQKGKISSVKRNLIYQCRLVGPSVSFLTTVPRSESCQVLPFRRRRAAGHCFPSRGISGKLARSGGWDEKFAMGRHHMGTYFRSPNRSSWSAADLIGGRVSARYLSYGSWQRKRERAVFFILSLHDLVDHFCSLSFHLATSPDGGSTTKIRDCREERLKRLDSS